MEGISRLDLPARKMFVNDLQNAVRLHSVDSSFTDKKSWKTESAGDTSFSIVWVQGNVSASGRGRAIMRLIHNFISPYKMVARKTN